MKSLSYWICSLLIIGSIVSLPAQQPLVTEDLDEEWGYDKTSSFVHTIRFSGLDLIRGEANASYEVVLFEGLGLEAGAGILLPWFLPEVITWETKYVENPQISYGFKGTARFYPGFDAEEGKYYGLMYRNRLFRSDLGTTTFQDITVVAGYNFLINKRFMLDINIGIGGFWFERLPDTDIIDRTGGFMVPLLVQIGYLL